MKIGIIVHSVTGNTLLVCQKLELKFAELGHDVELKEIKIKGKVNPGEKEAEFTEMPVLSGYEALVFGSHTEAFQLEQAMKLYFNKIEMIKDKKVACISTHQFPFKWMGGNSAVQKMKSLCEEKGAKVLGTAVVDWSPKSKRSEKIAAAVNMIASLF